MFVQIDPRQRLFPQSQYVYTLPPVSYAPVPFLQRPIVAEYFNAAAGYIWENYKSDIIQYVLKELMRPDDRRC